MIVEIEYVEHDNLILGAFINLYGYLSWINGIIFS